MCSQNSTGNNDLRDRIRGSLFGGAVGDALGYSVEFSSESQIFSRYGKEGITEYKLDTVSGKALISDDTQMSLFTANGLLIGDTRGKMRGVMGSPSSYVAFAYQDWYLTQTSSFESVNAHERYEERGGRTWLLDVPELFERRAPGNTCLSALSAGMPKYNELTKEHRVNQSKGCGGVMRIAPVALMYRQGENFHGPIEKLDREAAEIAAITHGHSLGFMSAAVISHIITNILTKPETGLKESVLDARNSVAATFSKYHHIKDLTDILDRAIVLSENNCTDLENIHKLGEGWVAEQTMAIAVYCVLRYEHDFSKAVIAAVNHNGDSDSTGAVTGNIVGAIVGYEGIEDKWKKNLELSDVILEMADDLHSGCTMNECGGYFDPKWNRKYIEMHRYTDTD